MNIVILIIAVFGGLIGVAATIYATLSIPAILFYKIYRCVRYRASLYD